MARKTKPQQLTIPGVEAAPKAPRSTARRAPAPKQPRRRVRRDPLLAALIGKLPASGQQWSANDRVAWLRMASIAFDVAYGHAGGVHEHQFIPATASSIALPASSRTAPIAAASELEAEETYDLGASQEEFRIDPDGFAMRGAIPITPEEVAACGGTIIDYRSPHEALDLTSVLWAGSGARKPETLPHLNIVQGIRKSAGERMQA